ncbi:hypothetical protein M199_gp144 [Halogranum tailed virus 1]|uniref:Uncharacterized protein n=1 Tax=Halogranum tailed virus 1 TaxID=1273749 RepID=R4TLF6_9CAUD|nr:hypothetical protein M199_gp144 [Halogranum tailed virus 1]AGM11522.1 hypothetical protein HGTV1_225 [Halogranum tailed virus 1]
MPFNFKDADGKQVVYSCQECIYCSTRKHFREDGTCVLCGGESKKI